MRVFFRIGGGSGGVDASQQEYETVQKPCGFIYQLQLLSTHGDQYYVGLNAIEIFNSNGDRIALTANGRLTSHNPFHRYFYLPCASNRFLPDVAAYPNNVNDLPGVQNDVRTVDKLVDRVNNTQDGAHMWLAPILPGMRHPLTKQTIQFTTQSDDLCDFRHFEPRLHNF